MASASSFLLPHVGLVGKPPAALLTPLVSKSLQICGNLFILDGQPPREIGMTA
jgi:hypothetical protein